MLMVLGDPFPGPKTRCWSSSVDITLACVFHNWESAYSLIVNCVSGRRWPPVQTCTPGSSYMAVTCTVYNQRCLQPVTRDMSSLRTLWMQLQLLHRLHLSAACDTQVTLIELFSTPLMGCCRWRDFNPPVLWCCRLDVQSFPLAGCCEFPERSKFTVIVKCTVWVEKNPPPPKTVCCKQQTTGGGVRCMTCEHWVTVAGRCCSVLAWLHAVMTNQISKICNWIYNRTFGRTIWNYN